MTAILWLLKSMSEHVITVVDEETNKISTNLGLHSKASTMLIQHVSISGGPVICVCFVVVPTKISIKLVGVD